MLSNSVVSHTGGFRTWYAGDLKQPFFLVARRERLAGRHPERASTETAALASLSVVACYRASRATRRQRRLCSPCLLFVASDQTRPIGGGSEPATRGVFASRTLDLEDIKVIGYDLDYTLIHYKVEAWEGDVYEQSKEHIRRRGVNVEGLAFDCTLVSRGLIIDSELGNLVKVDRFGYVRKAMHGTHTMTDEELGEVYGRKRVRVDLRDSRWQFLNTLFSTAGGCLYLQMVDRADQPEVSGIRLSYKELSGLVDEAVTATHMAGDLKKRIISNPSRYVVLDNEAGLTILDQRLAGKRIVLITNNDWEYVKTLMSYTYDRFLPPGLTWRSLFDLIIVNARKPAFWTAGHACWQIVDEERGLALCNPALQMEFGCVYCGGSARLVEECCGFRGEDVMYIGDHIYSDSNLSKGLLQWRTCLIIRELESEVRAIALSEARNIVMATLLDERDRLRRDRAMLLTIELRRRLGLPCEDVDCKTSIDVDAIDAQLKGINQRLDEIGDDTGTAWGINPRWGFLFRVGRHEKSHLMRQVEKHADLYTSRISNFLVRTPFAHFRAPLQSDRGFLSFGDESAYSNWLHKSMEERGDDDNFDIQHPSAEGMSWELDGLGSFSKERFEQEVSLASSMLAAGMQSDHNDEAVPSSSDRDATKRVL